MHAAFMLEINSKNISVVQVPYWLFMTTVTWRQFQHVYRRKNVSSKVLALYHFHLQYFHQHFIYFWWYFRNSIHVSLPLPLLHCYYYYYTNSDVTSKQS